MVQQFTSSAANKENLRGSESLQGHTGKHVRFEESVNPSSFANWTKICEFPGNALQGKITVLA